MKLVCGLIALDGRDACTRHLEIMAASLSSDIAPSTLDIRCSGPAGLAVLDFGRPDGPDTRSGIVTHSSGTLLAADVRLDEADDLHRELGTGRHDDAMLVAHALARWGREASAHLLGDFAFASWDPARHELLLARDIAGVRPLVYHHAPGRHFLFASFPRAIHASGLLTKQLDEAALIRSMYQQFDAVDTWSQGVSTLPAAHNLRLQGGVVDVRAYWQLERSTTRSFARPQDAAAELRSLVTRAVHSRLPRTGPVAAHLSGGLDSSAIAVIAARALHAQGRPLLGYSFLLDPADRSEHEDETPFVQAVLDQEPAIRWTPVHPPADELFLRSRLDADFGFVLDEFDPENVVCRDAYQKGAGVVLSGWGGDEGVTFNGRGMLAHALTHGDWLYLAREVAAQRKVRGQALARLILSEVVAPVLPQAIRHGARLLRRSGGTNLPDIVGANAPSAVRNAGAELRGGRDLRATHLALLRSAHLPIRNSRWAGIGARYGLAFAFPLLDRRIQEFAVSMPPTWHVRDGWRRRPYRDAMQGILPPLIQWRHDKLAPLPRTTSSMLAMVPTLRRRSMQLAQHDAVRRVIAMEVVRAIVDRLANAGPAPSNDTNLEFDYACATTALSYATYVSQHF